MKNADESEKWNAVNWEYMTEESEGEEESKNHHIPRRSGGEIHLCMDTVSVYTCLHVW